MTQNKPPINWPTTLWLVGSLAAALIAAPLYIRSFGFSLFELLVFLVMTYATGLSITVGYHRLFAHRSFDAVSPVATVAGLLGAATFQNSVLDWASEHRYHHKYVDRDGFPYDPYNINKGFFYAHMGWLIRKREPKLPRNNVADLEQSRFLLWQDRWILPLMVGMCFGFPVLLALGWGWLVGVEPLRAAMTGLVFGGIVRVVAVQHATFFINSLCHYLGRRPYDGRCTARDSGLVAFFTFGEGYHNFHHTFQADYRNGIRAWHFDPGKWVIWLLARLGLAWNLRRVAEETIRMARLREKRRDLEHSLSIRLDEMRHKAVEVMASLEKSLDEMHHRSRALWSEYRRVQQQRGAERRRRLREIRRELRCLRREFRRQFRAWEAAWRSVRFQLAAV